MAFITWLLIVLARLLIGAYAVMVVAGGVHQNVHEAVPAWGYGQAIWVSLALTVVGSYFYQPNDKS